MEDLEKIIKIARTAGYLKRLQRTGWARVGVVKPESVADHTFRVVLLCSVITSDRDIDHKKLLEMAVTHDIGETATSDVRTEEGDRFVASQEAKDMLEESVMKDIFAPLYNGKHYLNLYYEFRDQSSKEARLLKQIEKIEMALQAVEYKEMGLPEPLTREFVENARKYVEDRGLKELLEKVING